MSIEIVGENVVFAVIQLLPVKGTVFTVNGKAYQAQVNY